MLLYSINSIKLKGGNKTMNIKTSISIFAAALLLSACGSSSSSSDDSSSASTSGTAIDGYIKGASVYVDDVNKTITKSGGKWTIPAVVATNSIIEISGGIDEDTNATFEGVLRAPYTANNSVVTPLTTMIVALMENNESLTGAQATAQLALDLNVTEAELTTDYIATSSSALYKKAQQVQKVVEVAMSAASDDAAAQRKAFKEIMKSVVKSIKASGSFDLGIADAAAITSGITDAGLKALLDTATVQTHMGTALTNTIASLTAAETAMNDANDTRSDAEIRAEYAEIINNDTNSIEDGLEVLITHRNGDSCNDNNSSTTDDKYDGWTCVGTPIVVTPDDNATAALKNIVSLTSDMNATTKYDQFNVATTTGLTATISDFNASQDKVNFIGKVDGDIAIDTNGAYDGTVILTAQSDEATDVAITVSGLTADEEFAVQNGTLDILGELGTITVPSTDTNTSTDNNTSTDTNTTIVADLNVTVTADTTATSVKEAFTVATTTGLTATISDFNASADTITFTGKVDGDVAIDTNGAYDGTVILTVQSDEATDVAITLNGLTADEEFAVQNGTLDIIK